MQHAWQEYASRRAISRLASPALRFAWGQLRPGPVYMAACAPGMMDLVDVFKASIPPLDGSNYKGQHGKVGVVGGCAAYTGAPFFAALSAHKTGADLTYIVCSPEAGPALKTYSPDMIVLPLLPSADQEVSQGAVEAQLAKLKPWMPRMTVVVVGPGLGEDPGPQAAAACIITWARDAGLPLVIDGSGITTVSRNPSLVQGYLRCVLSPNVAELGRLATSLGVELSGPISAQWQDHVHEIAAALHGPLVVSKGPADIISDGSTSVACDVPGSAKRCGGIGDVLAGTLGCFWGWQWARRPDANRSEPTTKQLMAAAYSACSVVRGASHDAYVAEGRAMGAQDVIAQLHVNFVRRLGR